MSEDNMKPAIRHGVYPTQLSVYVVRCKWVSYCQLLPPDRTKHWFAVAAFAFSRWRCCQLADGVCHVLHMVPCLALVHPYFWRSKTRNDDTKDLHAVLFYAILLHSAVDNPLQSFTSSVQRLFGMPWAPSPLMQSVFGPIAVLHWCDHGG